MITVKLCGGFGNQLFQYAYGYQMAQRLNTGLDLDVSWFEHQNLREPDIFKLHIEFDNIRHVRTNNKWVDLANITIINRGLRVLGLREYRIGGYRYLKEARYKYDRYYEEYLKDYSYLDGYWQCPKYFDDVREDLLKLFDTNMLSDGVRELGKKLSDENSIAVHVRRGDYPKKKKITSRLLAISDKYYSDAINYMLTKAGDNPKFYIFSNDMNDAEQLLNPYIKNLIYKTEIKTNSIDEWYLMKCCKNLIIGNSTFSWWAAYLNENNNKIVCAPNCYMGNDDVLPERWHAINVKQ